MRIVIAVVGWTILLVLPCTTWAIGLFNGPESIVFDSLNNRYIVANYTDGNILAVDPDGQQSLFYAPGGNSFGSHIINDTLYITQSQGILAFDLITDQLLFNLPVSNSRWLDGITSDGSDYLYVVNTAGSIIKISISDHTYSTFANIGLNLNLQTCVYDGANNRLLAVEYAAAAPIKAVSLTDGSVTTAVTTTFGNFDGITIDDEGYIYVGTTTDGGRIYRYEPTFTDPPLVFWQVGGWPAGINYNQRDHILAIPCFYQDSLQFVADMYKVDSDTDGIVDALDNCPYSANPEQEDDDSDGIGNLCDNCPDTPNPTQGDIDGDGIGDLCEVLRTWNVRIDGMGDAPTIQAAIDSCTHGDTVMVSDGTYAGEGNRDLEFGSRSILLRSENGAAATIINCHGSPTEPHRAFSLSADDNGPLEIKGLTIRGGYGPSHQGSPSGGAVFCQDISPTFVNCVFTRNEALLGGAIYADNSDAQFVNCDFVSNIASYGSAIFSFNTSDLQLHYCMIGYNTVANAVDCMESGDADLYCTNVFGNQKGNWVGCLVGLQWINDNFSADPMFCNYQSGDCGLAGEESPCLPDNNTCGVLIGALGVGCSCDCGVAGDMNCDEATNPVDVVYLVNFVYKSQNALCDPPNCPYPVGDVDCNNAVNPVDIVYIVNAVYKSQNAICEGCNP